MAGQRVPTTEELSVPRSFKGMGNRPSSLEELLRLQAIEKSKRLATQRESYPPLGIKLEGYKPKFKPFVSSLDNINVEKIFNPDMPIEGDAVGPPTDSLKTVEQMVADGARPESVDQRFAPNPLPSGQTQQPSQIQEETFLDESVRQPTVLSDPKILAGETLRNHEWNNKLYKVPPTKESGFLDTILGGVRSFTSPIARGAKELFNDPKRMALITGGLRMADPNSYYDAQGFYSPWGGINAGLGTGIKTYKSLSEPTYKAKQKILHDNAKELATHEAQLKSQYGIDSKEWATWLQYKKMLPLNKQNDPNEYLKWKRSVPWLNRGSEFIQPPSTDVNNAKPRTIPKDLSPSEQPIHKQEVETHKAIGAGLGDDIASARSKLPMMELELAEMETLADEFINHAGFSDLIGATWKPFAKNIHGTDAAGADSIRKQLEGKLFMKAYQTLKGGGQITEIEGDQAKQAQGRMNIALSEKEYKKALTDFLDAYRRGLEKLKGVAYPVGTNPQRRKGDSKSRRSTDNLTEEEMREMETLKLELGK